MRIPWALASLRARDSARGEGALSKNASMVGSSFALAAGTDRAKTRPLRAKTHRFTDNLSLRG
jgi:hypothetical protein